MIKEIFFRGGTFGTTYLDHLLIAVVELMLLISLCLKVITLHVISHSLSQSDHIKR